MMGARPNATAGRAILWLAWGDMWRSLRLPALRRMGLVSILLTLALLVAGYLLLLLFRENLGLELLIGPDEGAMPGVDGEARDLFGASDPGFSVLLGPESLVLMLVLSVPLMVPIAALFAALMLDEIAGIVERATWSLPAPVAASQNRLKRSINFAGLVISANVLAAFIVVLLLPLFGIFTIFAWYAMNGWLLGREYFTLIAHRRLGEAEMVRLRKRFSGRIWLAGVLSALPMIVPLVNLSVPFLMGLWFTHIMHRANAAP